MLVPLWIIIFWWWSWWQWWGKLPYITSCSADQIWDFFSNASLSLNFAVVILLFFFKFCFVLFLGGRGLFLKREGHQFALKKDGMVHWYISLLLQSTTIVMYHMNHEKNIFWHYSSLYRYRQTFEFSSVLILTNISLLV